jgi:hypothetical protein
MLCLLLPRAERSDLGAKEATDPSNDPRRFPLEGFAVFP